jgi:hypothetical protein
MVVNVNDSMAYVTSFVETFRFLPNFDEAIKIRLILIKKKNV